MALTPQEAAALSQDELARLARDATPVNPQIITYAAGLSIAQAGNDAVLTFTRPRQLILANGELAPFMQAESVATIYMSTKTMKDFYLAIKAQVDLYEQTNGKIVTEYSRQVEK